MAEWRWAKITVASSRTFFKWDTLNSFFFFFQETGY